jgi:NAD-dependent dihydropyrimidine dehydrogenase PreA subunit
MRCALACSLFTTPEREFNPSKSRITVLPDWEQGIYEVTMSEECKTGCSICVDYCEFGVLSRHEEEVANG